jgi:hypothetical protein
MLTPGNRKLGERLVWGFGLPSGQQEICIGMTPTCQQHCYAIRFEAYRTKAKAKYQRNWALSQLPDFAQRMHYFILNHEVRVVRIHTGGEFYGVAYARKWLRIIRRLPEVQFFCYTRAWQDAEVKQVIDSIAELPNARVWYSCDRDTGLPSVVPSRVRLCWLMTHSEDAPPAEVDLVFRIARLRRQPQVRLNGARVCPDENGRRYPKPPHCESCGHCWRPLSNQPGSQRLALPLLYNNSL